MYGRVQGVGYRDFAEREARRIGVQGYARNLSDGSVEVLAMGSEEQLREMEGALRRGPRWADVREVRSEETAVRDLEGFGVW